MPKTEPQKFKLIIQHVSQGHQCIRHVCFAAKGSLDRLCPVALDPTVVASHPASDVGGEPNQAIEAVFLAPAARPPTRIFPRFPRVARGAGLGTRVTPFSRVLRPGASFRLQCFTSRSSHAQPCECACMSMRSTHHHPVQADAPRLFIFHTCACMANVSLAEETRQARTHAAPGDTSAD